MGYATVPYTFTNGTAADATQANNNFTALVNALSDGTKDISIAALVCAGTASLNGSVILGNTTGDDITVNGRIASHTIPKETNTYDIGSSSAVVRNVYATTVVAATLGGEVSFSDTTASTSSTTGAVKIAGGVGVAKSVFGGSFCSGTLSDLADDVATSITPAVTVGMIYFQYLIGGTSLSSCFVGFSVGATSTTDQAPTNITIESPPPYYCGGGALSNGTTDGFDGRFNICSHTDGKLYFKNRTGSAAQNIFYVIFGA